MTQAQRILFIAALLMAAVGIGLGFAHAAAVEHATIPVLNYRAQLNTAVNVPAPTSSAGNATPASHRYTRVVDAHTHIIKLATVLLLIALVYPLVSLPDKMKRALSAMFLIGSCVFPLGVFAEIYVRGRSAQVAAALGALLVIVSFLGMLWGLLRVPTRISADPSSAEK